MQTKKLRFKEHSFTIKSEQSVSDDDLYKMLEDFTNGIFKNCSENIKKIDIDSNIKDDDSVDVIIYIERYFKIPIINKQIINNSLKPFNLISKIVKKYRKNNIFLK